MSGDMTGLPLFPFDTKGDVQLYQGFSSSNGGQWMTWRKPRGVTHVVIVAHAAGGGGGSGAVGAASSAGGGGGGGSGGLAILNVPAILLPDVLYVSAGAGRIGTGFNSYVCFSPSTDDGSRLLLANGGTVGGAASGGTAGTGGGAGSATITALGRLGVHIRENGAAGGNGSNAAGPGNSNFSNSWTLATPGLGGAGLGANNSTGSIGGGFSANGIFPAFAGGAAAGTTTGNGKPGNNGQRFVADVWFSHGGTGGGSGGVAAGGGSGGAGGIGGNGAPGAGGGGGGGGFTGSTVAVGGRGGDGYVYIIAY